MNINFHICALFGQYQIGCCGYCLVKIHPTRLGIVISFIFHHDPVNHFCDPYLFVWVYSFFIPRCGGTAIRFMSVSLTHAYVFLLQNCGRSH